MANEIYTNEQIIEEVNKTLENPLLRRCCQCARRNKDCTRCEQLGIPISRFMYAGHCKFYKTDEEQMLEDARKAIAEKDKENRKQDRLLTMSFISAEMSIVFLEDFEARIKDEYNKAIQRVESKYKNKSQRKTSEDEEYLKDKKKEYKKVKDYVDSLIGALKSMDKSLKEARKQFTHFVEPKLNKAFFNEDHTAFYEEEYTNHGQDVFEMCAVNLEYFDLTYMNDDNSKSIKSHMASLPAERLMEKEDYKRYTLDLRR